MMTISIEADQSGNHFVSFPKILEELSLPELYSERMEWVRLSYIRFFQKIQEKYALLDPAEELKI